ncbi:MAG: hypothetical protein ACXABY_08035 [Candidatus Thorarchaeota archaeon]
MFALKEQVGDNLYCLNVPDDIVIPFRLLSLGEYNSCRTSLAIGVIPAQDVYDHIYKTCVLNKAHTEYTDDMKAGIPNLVAKVIYYMSGPNDIEFMQQLLDVERNVAQTFESQMKTTICRVFPGYTMNMLDDLGFPQMIKLFAEAESVLLQSGAISEPYKIVDKDQEKSSFDAHKALLDAERMKRI